MDSLTIEIVTPERLLVSQPVTMAVIPASEGEMGVLPGHAPVITIIHPGIIRLYEGEEVSHTYFVAGGFAEVTPERCTILAEEAADTKSIDKAQAEERVSSIQKQLSKVTDNDGSERLQRELAVAEAYLAAAA